MKKYTGTKTVEAFEIERIESVDFSSKFALYSADGYKAPVCVGPEYFAKHRPYVGGYYVRYEDGYESFSPAEAFEKAYRATEAFPPPSDFTAEELAANDVLKYFHYNHLPPHMQAISKRFCALAKAIVQECPRSPQRTIALNKLLESKDAAVRTVVL